MGVIDEKTWLHVLSQLIAEMPLMAEAADVLVEMECTTIPSPRVFVNGVGDDGHEPLILGTQDLTDGTRQPKMLFTKTIRKPYDLLVCLTLLRAKQLAGDFFVVSSDGSWDHEWTAARKLYNILWPGQHPECPWPANPESPYTDSALRPADADFVGLRNHTAASSQSADSEDMILSTRHVSEESEHTLRAEPQLIDSDISHHLATEVDSSSGMESRLDSVKLLNTALSKCENDSEIHSCCVPQLMSWEPRPGVKFRLIDVVKSYIVEEPNPAEVYVALSYVWGGVQQLQLTDDTHKDLIRPGSLASGSLQASKTIVDAMAVCRSLGMRYLWVDALCIKQDDTRDKAIQILRMRQVYASARLTIVAASGQDANASLFAPYVYSKFPTSETEVLQDTKWNSRAWTYQENRLSHRKLIFAPSGIYLRCQERLTKVDRESLVECQLIVEEESEKFIQNIPAPDSQLSAYYQAVSGFSNRELTFQSDLIDAFQGIMKSYGSKVDGQDNVFLWGLPTAAFDQAFCWRTDFHAPDLRRADYPSWSWLGWQQRVFWDQQHQTAQVRDRTSILLWSQRSPDFWSLPVGQYMMEDHKKRIESGLPARDAQMAHMFADRKACWYSDLTIAQVGTFMWGLPTNALIYHQGTVLRLNGSVAELEVRAVLPILEETHDGMTNRWYEILSHRTMTNFGKIKLDPVWRDTQSNELTFMLLDGVKESKGSLIGTHLMCLDETAYDNTEYRSVSISCQRLVVVQCETFISEDTWRQAGAVTKMIYLH